MNPFMTQMFFGPMGMSIMPFSCGCSMYSRPYEHDLSFFNFPIVRDTSMDWLLNPSIALQQCQQQWQSGNFGGFGYSGIGGMTFPGFNGGFWNPAINGTRTETEEEKKKREAREAETKKPEAEKAASLKKIFDNIKKLAEENDGFVNLSILSASPLLISLFGKQYFSKLKPATLNCFLISLSAYIAFLRISSGI